MPDQDAAPGAPMADNGPAVVPGPRLRALHDWLEHHPHARIAALGWDSFALPMPSDIVLGPQHVLEERSLLDLVMPDDRARVASGFAMARRTGQGLARVRLAADGRGIEIHYMDLAPDLPFLVRMCIDDEMAGVMPEVAPDRTQGRARLGIITKDEAARIAGLDDGAADLLGWRLEDVVGTSTLDHIHPDDREKALENWWSMHLGSGSQVVRIRYRRSDGSWLWLDTSNSYEPGGPGNGPVICQVIDASREMAAADALRRNEQLLRRLTESVPVGLCFIEPDRTISTLNASLAELLGTSDVPDLSALERLLNCDLPGSFAAIAAEALDDGRDGEIEVAVEHPDRAPVRCRLTLSAVMDQGDVTGALVCVVDVTELKRQATTDPLTGLLNRQAILQVVGDTLAVEGGLAGVLFLDLDMFKTVNDTFGHRVGDQLLGAVAERLRGAVRDLDVVGRLGGDEFIVLCPGLSRHADLERVAARIEGALSDPFELPDATVTVGVSIGMTIVDEADELPQRVVDRADAAMYAAKRQAVSPAWG